MRCPSSHTNKSGLSSFFDISSTVSCENPLSLDASYTAEPRPRTRVLNMSYPRMSTYPHECHFLITLARPFGGVCPKRTWIRRLESPSLNHLFHSRCQLTTTFAGQRIKQLTSANVSTLQSNVHRRDDRKLLAEVDAVPEDTSVAGL